MSDIKVLIKALASLIVKSQGNVSNKNDDDAHIALVMPLLKPMYISLKQEKDELTNYFLSLGDTT